MKCIVAILILGMSGILFVEPVNIPYLYVTPSRAHPETQEIDFPDAPPTSVIQVLGNVPGVDFSTWQNTGLSLRRGDTVYIKTEGIVKYVGNSVATPDGLGRPFSPALMPNIAFMSLVGRVHYEYLDDGIDSSNRGIYGPGFIGSAFKMVYQGENRYGGSGWNVLYLAVNDSHDNDNDFGYTVRIWIVNDGKVQPLEARKTENMLDEPDEEEEP